MVFLPVLRFPRKFVYSLSTFNMVLEWGIDQTLNNTTSDGNQTEETATSFSVAVATAINARTSATMDKLFCRLQTTLENVLSSIPPSSVLPTHHCKSYTRQSIFLKQFQPSHLCNPLLHPRPILHPTPRFMFCHLISLDHHHFHHQSVCPAIH